MTERRYLDRPEAKEPGGMECMCCGSIFIGDETHDLCRACAFMHPITLHRLPPESAPLGAPVLVAGGIAMRTTDGWVSGMESPPFTRFLNWEPKWWACIPQQNEDDTP